MKSSGQSIKSAIKSASKAILGLFIIFALIIVYIVINRINIGIGIVFTPVLAIVLWPFCLLLYWLFRKYNKQKLFLKGTALLYIFINVASGFGNIDVFFTNVFNFRILPSPYKTYQDIDQSIIHFGNKEMRLLATSDFKLEHCITENNYLIIRKDNRTYYNEGDFGKDSLQKPIEHLFYKYDINGELLETYKFIQYIDGDKEELIEGYLINTAQKYYNTWGLNGDTIRKEVKGLNQDLSWDKEKEDAMLQYIINNAAIYFHNKGKVVYRQNEEWAILNINQSYHNTPLRYYKNGKSDIRNNVFKYSVGHKHNKTAYFEDKVNYKYFHKEKFIRPTGVYKSDFEDRWKGTLYTDVIVGKDTLKLKENLYLTKMNRWHLKVDGEELGDFYRSKSIKSGEYSGDFDGYNYYENENLNYQLFSSSWSSHSKPNNIYVIKNIE